jgi:RNA polymerase sigma-70 factor (ECF subfamily)
MNDTQTESLNKDSEETFEYVFKTHFKGLYAYACTLIRDSVMAEEIVQNIFYRLWEKNEQLSIRESVSGYLYRSVYHESLNYLKHLKVREAYHQYAMNQEQSGNNTQQNLELKELEERLSVALSELPEKCRTIFQMCRFEELKYKEIAERLDLPVKTVENQMGKALKLLRLKLVDFLPVSFLLFFLMPS